jgi:hypothetical protein
MPFIDITGQRFVGLAALIATTPTLAEHYICTPVQKATCSALSGCKVNLPGSDEVITIDYADGDKQAIVKRCVSGCTPAIYTLQENNRFVQAIFSMPQGMERSATSTWETQAVTTVFGLDKDRLAYTFADTTVQMNFVEAGYCRKR